MITHRIFTACGVVACLLAASASHAYQYTNTIMVGFNAIANELDHVDDSGDPDGNTLNHIMGGDNTIGCWLMKYNNSTAQWLIAQHTAAGWSPDLTLGPGEGAFLLNPSGQAFDLTFTGNLCTNQIIPLPAPSPGLYSCQDATIASASYGDITGRAPGAGGQVWLWSPALPAYREYVVTRLGGWTPSAPEAPCGQSAWFDCTPTPPPDLFPSFPDPDGGGLSLFWLSGTLQQSSDLVTWSDVLDYANQPVRISPYTAPGGAGCLFFRLRF